MKSAVRKVSSNGGIMSPNLDARIDLARFQTGCLTSTNQIPADWGGSVTRSGLEYISRLNRFTVQIPYVVSASVSYMVLFSDQELRFMRNDEIIQDGGSDLVLATPYLDADLYELKVDSLVDLLWIAHPNYPPHQLTRNSETDWDFAELSYVKPPMIPRAGETATLTPSAQTGSISLTSSEAIFDSSHVGSYWRIGYDLEASYTERDLSTASGNQVGSSWLWVSGDWSFTTSGNWRGDIEIIRLVDSGEQKVIRSFQSRSELRNIATTGTEDETVRLRILFTDDNAPSTVDYPAFNPSAVIEVSNTKIYGLVKITAVNSPTSVQADVITRIPDTAATGLWEEGAWSDFRGYPAAVALHERRLMFSASQSLPNRYWASYQDDRQDWEIGSEAQDAFSFDLPSRDVVTWMIAERQLIIGTRREEVIVSSGRDDLPLSPENSIARVNGSIGSSRVPALRHRSSIFYAERRGRRIREMLSDGADGFTNTDVTAFAPHLFDANILQMSSAQADQKLVYVLLSNRKLLCMNHDRDQAMASWFVIETQGDFESVASLPGDQDEDATYVITRRTIDGQEVRQIEKFATNQWDLVEQGDPTHMIYSDMAKTFDFGTPTSVITGLEDWEGMELQVLGDGAVQPNRTVLNGEITTNYPASIMVIGLPYESDMTPMWFDDVNSPTQGRFRKVAKVYFSMYQGGNVSLCATDEDVFGALEVGEELQSFTVARRVSSDPIGSAPKLENGYFTVSLDSRHSRKQSVTFKRNSPLPMIIQSLHLHYNVGDK